MLKIISHILAKTAAENSRGPSSRSRRSGSGHAPKPREDQGPGGETRYSGG